MAKKNTFTCKICGQEHAGMICTKFTSLRVLKAPERKTVIAGLLAAPKPAKKTVKAKKAKRTKKRKVKQASKAQPVAKSAGKPVVLMDKTEDKS